MIGLMSDKEKAAMYRNAADDLRNEASTLRAQLEQERARVAQLHQAAYPLYSWCAEHLSYEQFKEAYQYGHALGQILEAEHPAVEAFIKRKQAEAVEAAAEKFGDIGIGRSPFRYELTLTLKEEALGLLQQADEAEKGGSDE